jgi:asparagine synthase (glutamine-hydrolysing)
MCGIAGTAALADVLPPSARAMTVRMGEALIRRGPDGAGSWSDDHVALSHRRLAVLDVSAAGAQPMESASGRFVVVFNGEIYNFTALSTELQATGWLPHTTCDTEVLLAAVERWGLEAAVQRFDGMFAFALYDRTDQVLSLVRDRFGEKPLVYAVRGDRVWFASEVRGLEASDMPPMTISRQATVNYFRVGHVSGTHTIYSGVHRVAPATIVSFDLTQRPGTGGGPRIQQYWNLPGPPMPVSLSAAPADDTGLTGEQSDELLEILTRSVGDRLVSDRPLGAFLSGGIDSSLACALAAGQTSGALKTFTMGWDDTEYDESVQAAGVAQHLGSDHTDVRLDRADAAETALSLGTLMDEPHADYSQIAVLMVSRAARTELVVALSGDGGDEMFAGYNRHTWLPRVTRLRNRVPHRTRGPLANGLRAMAPALTALSRPLPASRRPRMLDDKLTKLANTIDSPDAATAYDDVITLNPSIGQPQDLPEVVLAALASRDPSVALWGLRAADLHGYLPDDVLTKVDRATMAVSLESRTPYLHAGLAEFAMHLPPGALVFNGRGKQPLRRLLASLLPGADFSQTKMGFGVPIASLLRHELAELLECSISDFRSRTPPPELDAINWEGMRQQLMDGDDSVAHKLWTLVAFEVWARRLAQFPGWEDPEAASAPTSSVG